MSGEKTSTGGSQRKKATLMSTDNCNKKNVSKKVTEKKKTPPGTWSRGGFLERKGSRRTLLMSIGSPSWCTNLKTRTEYSFFGQVGRKKEEGGRGAGGGGRGGGKVRGERGKGDKG